MSPVPHISLEQWRALVAVVEAGGYAPAAERLHKSQSTVTYAVQRIEAQLGVKAFELVGRRAQLTPVGQMLYRRARQLVDEAAQLEKSARRLSAGWEAEIWLAVEVLFPTWLLFDCLARFGQEAPGTRIEVLESVLRGAPEALTAGQADLAITPHIPPGFLGEPLMSLRTIPVAHPAHPLHALGRPLTATDLRGHRHVVVRDSGATRDRRTTTVEVDQRWTLGHMASSIDAVARGHGFAWLPEERIRPELERGVLAPLPMRDGGERRLTLYLVVADPDFVGPGVARLAELIREGVARECAAACTE
jgi:DNA-binding transcriptional LysR family regulator